MSKQNSTKCVTTARNPKLAMEIGPKEQQQRDMIERYHARGVKPEDIVRYVWGLVPPEVFDETAPQTNLTSALECPRVLNRRKWQQKLTYVEGVLNGL